MLRPLFGVDWRIPRTRLVVFRTSDIRMLTVAKDKEMTCAARSLGSILFALVLVVVLHASANAATRLLSGSVEARTSDTVTVRGTSYTLTKESHNKGTVALDECEIGDGITVAVNALDEVLWYRLTGREAITKSAAEAGAERKAMQKANQLAAAEGRQQRLEHTPGSDAGGRVMFKTVAELNISRNDDDAVDEWLRVMTRKLVTATDAEEFGVLFGLDTLRICLHKDVTWMETNHLASGLQVLGTMPPSLYLADAANGRRVTALALKSKIQGELENRGRPPTLPDVIPKAGEEVFTARFDLSADESSQGCCGLDRVIDKKNVRVFREADGTMYWGPTIVNEYGKVVYRIELPGEFVAFKKWQISVAAYNVFFSTQFDDGAQCALEVSRDGRDWILVQSNLGIARPVNNHAQPFTELVGTRSIYLRAAMKDTVKHASIRFSQFARCAPSKGEIGSLEIIVKK
jgi:hypothetical protein